MSIVNDETMPPGCVAIIAWVIAVVALAYSLTAHTDVDTLRARVEALESREAR